MNETAPAIVCTHSGAIWDVYEYGFWIAVALVTLFLFFIGTCIVYHYRGAAPVEHRTTTRKTTARSDVAYTKVRATNA
jgi:hypothetical protein